MKQSIKAEDIKLTSEDIRNGWTTEKLVKYLNQRNDEQRQHAVAARPKSIKVENVRMNFNPHNWNV